MNPQEDGDKLTVSGRLVKILIHRREDRGMSVDEWGSRCVRSGEVHELVTTDQHDTTTGARVDRVGFLGFVEISEAGVVDRGDPVVIDGKRVGSVLGFDSCHFPNHYNILIAVDATVTGRELGLTPDMKVLIGPQP